MAQPDPTDESVTGADTLDTRDASLWPDTARLHDAGLSTQADTSRFDPLYEHKARERWRLSRQFDLCRPALGLRVLVFVQIVVALPALPLAQGAFDLLTRATVLAFAALAGALLWLPVACALRAPLVRLGQGRREAVLMALGAVAALVGWGLVAALGLVEAGAWPAVGASICGGVLAFVVWRWLGLRAQAAQPVEASARLAELQSRIRPHFLFNALNTALALVQVDPHKAEGVLEDLSQLFRVALAEAGTAVTLDEEIDLAQRYLAIEKLRFGERLELSWDLDPAANAALVPPLVLQPLVENAVRHGIEPSLRGGRIRVRTRVLRGMVELLVTNTLPDEPGRRGSGMALANVAERLRLLHDMAATLDTQIADGLYQARIVVPL